MARWRDRMLARFSIVVALPVALAAFTGAVPAARTTRRSVLPEPGVGRRESMPDGEAGSGTPHRPDIDARTRDRDGGERSTPGDLPTGKQPGPRNAAEWTTLGISAVIVATLVATAVYEHLARTEPSGAWVSVRVDVARAEQRAGLFYIPFTVANTGGEPAENVAVVFEVKRGEETVEESTTEVAFLPNSGSTVGELVTALDPAAHTIEARVATLQFP